MASSVSGSGVASSESSRRSQSVRRPSAVRPVNSSFCPSGEISAPPASDGDVVRRNEREDGRTGRSRRRAAGPRDPDAGAASVAKTPDPTRSIRAGLDLPRPKRRRGGRGVTGRSTRGERHARLADVAQARFGSRSRQRSSSARSAAACRPAARPVDVLPQHRGQHVGDVVAVEGAPARQHLVDDDAERPDVRALVDGSARAPARAPCRRPCRESCPSASARDVSVGEFIASAARRRPVRIQRLRQPEVEDLHRAVGVAP